MRKQRDRIIVRSNYSNPQKKDTYRVIIRIGGEQRIYNYVSKTSVERYIARPELDGIEKDIW